MKELQKILSSIAPVIEEPRMSTGDPSQFPKVEEEVTETQEVVEEPIKKPDVTTSREPSDSPEQDNQYDALKKMRDNIAAYEQKIKGGEEKGSVWEQGKLQDTLSGLHNILNYASGSQQANLSTDAYSKNQKGKQDKKAKNLNQLQELQKLYNNYQANTKKTKKDALTAYQKAQLDEKKADRELRLNLAKLAKEGKSENKKVTKFQEEKEKDVAERFSKLEEAVPNTLSSIEEAKFIRDQIEKDNISTGPGAATAGGIGSFFGTEESSLKERLDSLAEKAARAQLKANGETRPTDADVEGMKKAMFNLRNTEETNVSKLNDFIKQQEATINEYNQMKSVVDQGRGLEDFKLEPTYVPKQVQAPYGEEVERNGKKYKFNPVVGKYQLLK